jgi:hypothetical protein
MSGYEDTIPKLFFQLQNPAFAIHSNSCESPILQSIRHFSSRAVALFFRCFNVPVKHVLQDSTPEEFCKVSNSDTVSSPNNSRNSGTLANAGQFPATDGSRTWP